MYVIGEVVRNFSDNTFIQTVAENLQIPSKFVSIVGKLKLGSLQAANINPGPPAMLANLRLDGFLLTSEADKVTEILSKPNYEMAEDRSALHTATVTLRADTLVSSIRSEKYTGLVSKLTASDLVSLESRARAELAVLEKDVTISKLQREVGNLQTKLTKASQMHDREIEDVKIMYRDKQLEMDGKEDHAVRVLRLVGDESHAQLREALTSLRPSISALKETASPEPDPMLLREVDFFCDHMPGEMSWDQLDSTMRYLCASTSEELACRRQLSQWISQTTSRMGSSMKEWISSIRSKRTVGFELRMQLATQQLIRSAGERQIATNPLVFSAQTVNNLIGFVMEADSDDMTSDVMFARLKLAQEVTTQELLLVKCPHFFAAARSLMVRKELEDISQALGPLLFAPNYKTGGRTLTREVMRSGFKELFWSSPKKSVQDESVDIMDNIGDHRKFLLEMKSALQKKISLLSDQARYLTEVGELMEDVTDKRQVLQKSQDAVSHKMSQQKSFVEEVNEQTKGHSQIVTGQLQRMKNWEASLQKLEHGLKLYHGIPGDKNVHTPSVEAAYQKMSEKYGGTFKVQSPHGGAKRRRSISETGRRIFKMVDKDHKGLLSCRKLIQFLRENPHLARILGLPHSVPQEDSTRNIFEEIYQAMDKDDDRNVTEQEFVAFFSESLYQVALAEQMSVGVQSGSTFQEGTRVLVWVEERRKYSTGVIQKVKGDAMYDVLFDSTQTEERVSLEQIQALEQEIIPREYDSYISHGLRMVKPEAGKEDANSSYNQLIQHIVDENIMSESQLRQMIEDHQDDAGAVEFGAFLGALRKVTTDPLVEQAASVLQRHFRGHLARKEVATYQPIAMVHHLMEQLSLSHEQLDEIAAECEREDGAVDLEHLVRVLRWRLESNGRELHHDTVLAELQELLHAGVLEDDHVASILEHCEDENGQVDLHHLKETITSITTALDEDTDLDQSIDGLSVRSGNSFSPAMPLPEEDEDSHYEEQMAQVMELLQDGELSQADTMEILAASEDSNGHVDFATFQERYREAVRRGGNRLAETEIELLSVATALTSPQQDTDAERVASPMSLPEVDDNHSVDVFNPWKVEIILQVERMRVEDFTNAKRDEFRGDFGRRLGVEANRVAIISFFAGSMIVNCEVNGFSDEESATTFIREFQKRRAELLDARKYGPCYLVSQPRLKAENWDSPIAKVSDPWNRQGAINAWSLTNVIFATARDAGTGTGSGLRAKRWRGTI